MQNPLKSRMFLSYIVLKSKTLHKNIENDEKIHGMSLIVLEKIVRDERKKLMAHIKDLRSGIDLFKALGSDVRIEILEILSEYGSMNMNEIAKRLNLTNGAVTMHVKKLKDSGLIDITTTVGKHGV